MLLNVSSINNTDINTFYHSFIGCIVKNFKNKFLIIEDISDNSILIKYLVKFFNIKFKSNTDIISIIMLCDLNYQIKHL